jgi:hypothetical protein
MRERAASGCGSVLSLDEMRIPLCICVMLLTCSCSTPKMPAEAAGGSPSASAEGPVWFWFTGHGSQMSIDVLLDQALLYHHTFPVSAVKRSSPESRGHNKSLHFSFTAPRPIVWEGYKDDDQTIPRGRRILGDIWLAGSEPDCLLLGVSFMDRHDCYMNTIHIAHPNQRDESLITPGLLIVTSPLGLK